ncbi:hypothetical protein [Streptomyces sp. DHE17-7]|uniref:hypothetical protein n=1 Tax=Streptomyces sp. DHE17-7 TaxID=2759949 RepID=UPI0022EB8437|nr:hypothetical protein [Streptomyces sp. DHE17-7]MBJ6622139.1 hypothetical protein [Streptomyces sp. DHE17-7]
MDRRRLALIRSGRTGEGRLTVGSGYLIAPRLVLTARHVLEDRDTGTRGRAATGRGRAPRRRETTRAGTRRARGHPG